MDARLEQLLQNNTAIWCGRQHGRVRKTSVAKLATGYAELDDLLHRGGWAQGATNELALPCDGVGELRLLLPALSALLPLSSQADVRQANARQANINVNTPHGYVVWIAPPFLPYAPALLHEQLATHRLLLVQASNLQDVLWAAEQAMLSDACSAVFTWTGDADLSMSQLRRLQLAAEQTDTWHVLFRRQQCLQQASPSPLRLLLQPHAQGKLQLDIVKQPGGWAGQSCLLSLSPHYEQWQRLPAHLLPVGNHSDLPIIVESPQLLTDQQASAPVTQLV